MAPNARQERLLVQELEDETIVYDQERDHVHRLNRTAAWVWRHCDGKRTAPDLAALLGAETGAAVDPEIVWLALDRLDKAHLLAEPLVRPSDVPRLTRRDILRRAALTGGLTLLLPVVQSLVAPTPAMAASVGCTKRGHVPTPFRPCCPGLRDVQGRCAGRGGI